MRCTVSVAIILTPSFYHLVASQSLQSLLRRWEVPYAACALAVAALMAPLAQMQARFKGL